jgi:shikimate dehydrogenase
MGVPYAEVIGDPIAHSKSPLIHKFWLEKMRMAGDYRRTRVTAADLPGFFAERRSDGDWRGCNVTMPLKSLVASYLDGVDPSARRIGAVNTVVNQEGFLLGINTDWQGVKLALGTSQAEKDVVLVGAGGAARAALEELRQAKPRSVTIMNRSIDKAEALLAHFDLRGAVRPIGDAPPADLLINATALGMDGQPPLDIGLSALRPDAIVFEMVYHPLETELLRKARAMGLRTIDGLSMLVWQASMAFTHFFGEPPEEVESAALRELLTQ